MISLLLISRFLVSCKLVKIIRARVCITSVASKKVENLITRPFSSVQSVGLCADKEIPSLDYVYHDMGLRELLVREHKEATGGM